tara:strand:+ start:3542 stop:4543 length:1002 start_codon:yes stop_codon:yes gene_type:complete
MPRKTLVTGSDGFIGSHLVESLVKDGLQVKAFCFYNSNNSWGWLDTVPSEIKDNLEIFLGDIRDPHCVKKAMIDCETVYHLAALIGIPYSYVAPTTYVDTNIHGTLNIVQAARELEIKKVIHTSTSETYGSAQYVPINEKHPIMAQSPYAASKIGADQIALSYHKSFGTPVSILRPFNTYGPRQSNRAVIPTIISQIASGKRKIKLGSVFPTRDFNFVEDTCNAFRSVAKSDASTGRVINSASNFEISIQETAMMIAEIMNVEIEIISDDNRIRPEGSEVSRLYGDNKLLKNLTDWKPNFSGIDGFKRGLKLTIDWFSKEENLNFYKTNLYTI